MSDANNSDYNIMQELTEVEIEAVAGGFEFMESMIRLYEGGSGSLGTFKYVTCAMWAETTSWFEVDGSSESSIGRSGAGVHG